MLNNHEITLQILDLKRAVFIYKSYYLGKRHNVKSTDPFT